MLSTLYLVATMVAAMLGAMLLFFGKQENIPALKWWGTAYLLGAASVALWTLGGDRLGETLSLALSAVGFVACGMVWNASRVFHGRKPNLPGLVLGAIAWIAAVMTVAPEASAMRMTVGAGIVAIYAALTATELWSERRRTLQKRWPGIVVPVLHGFVLMLPILLGDLLHPHDKMFSGSIVGDGILRRACALCGRHRVRHLHAGVGADGHGAQDGGFDGSADRHVQSPRFRRGDVTGDRARSQRRPSGDGVDFRYRSFQIDQRPLRPSGGRRNSQAVLPPSWSTRCVSATFRAGSAARSSRHCCPVRWRKG